MKHQTAGDDILECSRERQIKAMEKDIRDLKVERGYLLFRLSAARERITELEAAESRETALREALGNYADKKSWEWTGDGYVWAGGKWDYRRPPYEDAVAALAPESKQNG